MIALVRIALSRPYTFVVLALVILIAGPLAALRTPTDIFPDIRIPVIGGLIFATIATLIFVPVVFSMVHKKVAPKPAAPLSAAPAH